MKKTVSYIRRVNYYETDKMGITHHSNYVRWMEEARVEYLRQIGISYKEMEDKGIVSPVIGLSCKYHLSTGFDDEVEIFVSLKKYNGVKFSFEYTIKNTANGKTVLTAASEHCLLKPNATPAILKKDYPEYDKTLNECLKD